MTEPADDVLDLFRALHGLHTAYYYSSHEPVANRAVVRLRQALEQVVGLAIVHVLDEMQSGLADPQVQQVGVSFLKAVVADSKGTTKNIIQRAGVEQVLVRSMTSHPCTENLLTEALAVLDELHGMAALLQALEHLRPSAPGTRAALQTLRITASKRWQEVEQCPPVPLTRVIIDALRAHPTETDLLILGMQLLGDLAALPELRVAFFQLNGWDWLLQVLESQPSKDSWEGLQLQQEGVRLIAQLCRGGASGEIHSRRVEAILEQVLQRSQNDGRVLYWGLWAVQQLHGFGSLLGTLRAHSNPDVVKQTLRSLSDLAWGQGEEAESAEAQHAMQVLQNVIEAMRSFAGDTEVLREAAFVLARTAAFATQHEGIAPLREAALVAASALIELLQAKGGDSGLLQSVLEAIGEFLEMSQGLQSVVRARICEGLSAASGSGAGTSLLSKVSAEHESNARLQGVVMWVAGLSHGVAAIVTEMQCNQKSFSVQIAALRALTAIYSQQIDQEAQDANMVTRTACIQVVLSAMTAFPENVIVWTSACGALSAVAQHGVDTTVTEEHLFNCLQAATKALTLAKSQENGWNQQASYLREEGVKLLAAVCCAAPNVGCWLRQNSETMEAQLGEIMEIAVSIVAKDKEQRFTEEALRNNLMALVYVVGPEAAIVKSLRQWGARANVVGACSDVVAETMRRQHASICEELSRGHVRAELENAAKAHVVDIDQERQGCLG